MLAKEITYEDYDGVTRTEIFHFNLSKTELLDMEVSEPGGFKGKLQRLSKSYDPKEQMAIFKTIIKSSYGEKVDGKYFKKSEEIFDRFYNSPAYEALFMEVFSDADKAIAFIEGIMPPDVMKEVKDTPEYKKTLANVSALPSSATE